MKHLVIVGGSDAGISAALRARELESSTQVTLIAEDAFPNYSICGLPFYLSGEVQDYHQLAHRTREEITDAGIDLLLDHRVQAVDPGEHLVTVVDWAEHVHQLSYDRLVLSTGRDRGDRTSTVWISRVSFSCIRWKTAFRCGTISQHTQFVR